MKSYYYLDYLHREIFLEEEDIQTVPESGRADDALFRHCRKAVCRGAVHGGLFPDTQRCGQPPVRFPLILKAATMR
ncbi:hypothetical protein NXW09_29180 [Bacteroides ovatus]|nr:hypothetical protein [Bacteroides ovatus]